jgi:putative tryptophan/tyrosine transport system substrate-binding protein
LSGCTTSRASPGPAETLPASPPYEPSLGGKWVSQLKEVAPSTDRLGIVYNPEPGNNSAAFRRSIDEVAKTSGIVSIETPVGDSGCIERLIFSLREVPNSGLIFLPDVITAAQKDRMVAIVRECRLPAVYPGLLPASFKKSSTACRV